MIIHWVSHHVPGTVPSAGDELLGQSSYSHGSHEAQKAAKEGAINQVTDVMM